ncbi:MAG: SURF1 family protein, partial [Caldimonas sp.]
MAGTAGTARLGLWQLDRAAQKIALQQQIEGRRALPPIPADSLGTTPAAAAVQHYRRTTLRGVWLAGYTVFLDNRQMNGMPGFFVVTPFKLENRAEAVLVQRGWVVRHFDDRTALPSLPLPTGSVEIEGSIAPPPSRLYEFSGAASGSIRQNIDLEAFGQE